MDKNTRALICGSLAYDTIMVFPDRFQRHILPDQVHILNVAFLVPQMRREFGGCAGNIAYNYKLLGGEPVPMATVGDDFTEYARRFKELGITQQQLKWIPDAFTAQAFITTDLDDNQITAFHPGAMEHSHENHVRDVPDIAIGLVGPDGREAMLQHAREFHERDIPFIFDPGQAMPLFDGEEFKEFIRLARWVAVNDYECKLLVERTGWSVARIAQEVDAFFVTRGSEGSEIHTPEGTAVVPVVPAEQVADPTGCGDAYRAGLLYGLVHELDLETTCRIASLMGSIKIAHRGTQNHHFTQEAFRERFQQEFGYVW